MYGRHHLATLERNDTRYNDNQHNDTHYNKLEGFIVLCQKDLPGTNTLDYYVQGNKHLTILTFVVILRTFNFLCNLYTGLIS
jgi:hypothetical protein